MAYSNQGRFRGQVSFLRRQYLQEGNLPFTDILSEETVKQALTAVGACWLDRIYSPIVTLQVFLGQVLSADHSCRSAVARFIAHLLSHGQRACSAATCRRLAKQPLVRSARSGQWLRTRLLHVAAENGQRFF